MTSDKFFAKVESLDELIMRGVNRVLQCTFIAATKDKCHVTSFDPPVQFIISSKGSDIPQGTWLHLNKVTSNVTMIFRFDATTSVTPDNRRNPEYEDVNIPLYNIGKKATFETQGDTNPFTTKDISVMDFTLYQSSYRDRNLISSTIITVAGFKYYSPKSETPTPDSTPAPTLRTPPAIMLSSPSATRFQQDEMIIVEATAPEDPMVTRTIKFKGHLVSTWRDDLEIGQNLLLLNIGTFKSARGGTITAFDGTAIRALLACEGASPISIDVPSLAFAKACETSFNVGPVTIACTKGNYTAFDGKITVPISIDDKKLKLTTGPNMKLQGVTCVNGTLHVSATSTIVN